MPSSPTRNTPRCSASNRCLGAVEDAIEHRLRVGHRAADHLQHLGGRGLLLQRLLGLVEQPRVLDRDHGLVGEGLEQREFLVGERPHVWRRRRSTPTPRSSQASARSDRASPRRGPRMRAPARTRSGTSAHVQHVGARVTARPVTSSPERAAERARESNRHPAPAAPASPMDHAVVAERARSPSCSPGEQVTAARSRSCRTRAACRRPSC